MTDTTQPPAETLAEAQDKRRMALIERIGRIADMTDAKPLEGALGDIAYDLLRQAAAQISSDRLHINRLSRRAGGDAIHTDDLAVDLFAARMKAKLAAARAKGRGGWDDSAQCSPDYLRDLLHDHVRKGDPVDVANFCMMLDHYGASTTPTPPAGGDAGDVEDTDSPAARLDMVRAALHGILDNPSHAKAYAKAGLDLLDLTSAERAIQRGEAV